MKASLVGDISCKMCGVSVSRTAGNQCRCPECRVVAEARRKREWLTQKRRKRSAPPLGVIIRCAGCSMEIVRTAPSRLYCKDCRPRRNLEIRRKHNASARAASTRKARYDSLLSKSAKFMLNNRIRAGIKQSLRRRGKDPRGTSWEGLVSFSLDELCQHLERQFANGMSWNNMGQWHIDHIVPLVAFSFHSPASVRSSRRPGL